MPQSGQRRSERILVDVPLVIRGETSGKQSFREETFTVTINAHGALVMLEARVAIGQKIVVMNPKNWDEREASVAYLGQPHAGLAQVAFEFNRPAPEFWSLDPPPQSWSAL
ncbi:MAG TPA: hypothetical protein VLY23_18615 [Candidatus Acidoferrum sp.]|nr:hypothetical protein [Candidatus Acidoferrum sp.]